MYLLDTNIISMLDPRRQAQAPALVDWIERNGASLFLSEQTITEMDAGVLKLRREKKRERADELGELVAAILAEFRDRVLPIDIDTARHIARLAEKTYRQPIPLANLIVAATAVRHGLSLLTRNMNEMGRLAIGARDPIAKLPPDA
jgi:toxin FitB